MPAAIDELNIAQVDDKLMFCINPTLEAVQEHSGLPDDELRKMVQAMPQIIGYSFEGQLPAQVQQKPSAWTASTARDSADGRATLPAVSGPRRPLCSAPAARGRFGTSDFSSTHAASRGIPQPLLCGPGTPQQGRTQTAVRRATAGCRFPLLTRHRLSALRYCRGGDGRQLLACRGAAAGTPCAVLPPCCRRRPRA
jgi:hypothetical protein